jgi:[ribosomal protein S5]-alanine N-acetyltransferase
VQKPVATGEPACTARVTLEERRAAHAEELFELLRDPRLYTFLDEEPPQSVQALREKLARSESRRSPDGKERWLNWIVRADSGHLAGYVQATVEQSKDTNVAYVFGLHHQGRGIATAAVATMLKIVVEQYEARCFFVVADASNHRSLRLAERLGFTPAPTELAATRQVGPHDRVLCRPVCRAAPQQGAKFNRQTG